MIQGPLRNTREGLHAADSMQTSNENQHALIVFVSPNIPETITLLIQMQEQDVKTLLNEENKTNPDVAYCSVIL